MRQVCVQNLGCGVPQEGGTPLRGTGGRRPGGRKEGVWAFRFEHLWLRSL